MSVEQNSGPAALFEQLVASDLHAVASRITELLSKQIVVTVAVVGGSASGKSSIVTPVLQDMFPESSLLREDNYCRGNQYSASLHGQPNLHVFEDYDPARIEADLISLKAGQGLAAPTYSYNDREPSADVVEIQPHRLIIMEGLYLFQEPVRDVFDLRVFIDTNDHERFVRRMIRPRRNPAQSDTHRVREYCELSYPYYHKEVASSQQHADIIINNVYTTVEGIAKLADSTGSVHPFNAVVQRAYHHPAMTESEQLTVGLDTEGMQRMSYLPDINRPETRADFIVPTSDYTIDLRQVGYTAIAPVV